MIATSLGSNRRHASHVIGAWLRGIVRCICVLARVVLVYYTILFAWLDRKSGRMKIGAVRVTLREGIVTFDFSVQDLKNR